MPESIIAFLDGRDFEDIVRLAVSLGGDTDTMACIAGSIAACVYPIPREITLRCEEILAPGLLATLRDFERATGPD
ncbi:ADP-ribosylglycohydrolase family protein [Paramuribaculum intestinale]|uniref:ADP-ribosylglycohydrolase family protein n=1 Tax=Paramuribaculum intestinale TaxID=2094151 RepID=UPI0025B6D6B5|nr:ADP-ribosylglycohydrolase family protein [Paramuribaculum intestinale]